MKSLIFRAVILLLTFQFLVPISAQEVKLTAEYKADCIQSLSKLMNEDYVFPEVAKKTEQHLQEQLKAGHFATHNDLESFAEALTESVQSVNKDKHMRIRPNPPYEAPENTPARRIEEQLNLINFERKITAGLNTVKKMEGNVGYLDLRGFAPPKMGIPIADSYMNLLATSDAIIVDLRKNGGGSPVMVQYLCSYFFDKKVHLNSLYWRQGDRTEEFWTLDEINGKRMPNVPLFVLTGDRTFSGAEEFAYNMQTQKRAVLVGQTTGGGANPGGMMPINKDLSVFIPTGRAINPISKTNWEGVGVVPEVKCPKEEALDKAHVLAKVAAEKFRTESDKTYTTMLTKLYQQLDSYTGGSSNHLQKELETCLTAGILDEWGINMLGYNYLNEPQKTKTAVAILKVNTQMFPESANVYDSYAEALLKNGDLKLAQANYQKAVDIGRKNGDDNLDYYLENLEKVSEQLVKKP